MNSIITKHELWNLSAERISELTKGQSIKIVQTNGEINEIAVKEIFFSPLIHRTYLFH